MKVIQVRVKPRARVSALEQSADGSFVAQVKAAPADGEANAELVALVARWFNCRKSSVTIKSGASSRTKLVSIQEP